MFASRGASPNLDAIFAALADPTRRAIVARLAAGEATVLDLAAPFAITLPAISRHLKVLEHAGLISRGRDAQRRPCRLRAEAIDAVTAWSMHTREAWQERFDNLDEYLTKLTAGTSAGATHAAPKAKPRNPSPNEKQKRKPHARKVR